MKYFHGNEKYFALLKLPIPLDVRLIEYRNYIKKNQIGKFKRFEKQM